MRGVSKGSFNDATERLQSFLSAADPATLGDELFGVLGLLHREHMLRRALSDPARPAGKRTELASVILDGKVSAPTRDFAAELVGLPWARSTDLTDAVETLAVIAEAASAQTAGRLDDLEDELFRFGRIIEAQPDLRRVLVDPRVSAERKSELLNELLADRTTPATLRLIIQAATFPRGRSLERVLTEFGRIAAERRDRLIAVVRTAVELSEPQKARLVRGLSDQYGRDVHLNIEVDPSVLGGLSIQVGDEEIDGTIVRRLEDVRRRIERAS
jgi:F-type H+-transporting ATPase subunit delta